MFKAAMLRNRLHAPFKVTALKTRHNVYATAMLKR